MAPSSSARKPEFLRILRKLVETYQMFIRRDTELLKDSGLTVPQFDIVATLGNTPGMLMGELAERTLITKGSLTGIVDRLEAKGLVERRPHPEDRRACLVSLTSEGVHVFDAVFPRHIARHAARFADLTAEDYASLHTALDRLRQRLS